MSVETNSMRGAGTEPPSGPLASADGELIVQVVQASLSLSVKSSFGGASQTRSKTLARNVFHVRP